MKQQLLQAMAETRQKEEELVALCSDEPADPSGRWHPKDHLAHIAWWREREAAVIDAVRTGAEVPPDLDGESHNAVIYEATRDQTASTVIANARRSWDAIESVVGACSEEDFVRPHPHRKERKLADGSPGDHLAAHLFWCHIEAGDEKAAEAILRWARDLSARTSTDPRTHAVGTYNLACFYARTRRAAEAVPLLQQSFVVAPDLKEWSLKDPDLDPIRDDPLVMELMGVKA